MGSYLNNRFLIFIILTFWALFLCFIFLTCLFSPITFTLKTFRYDPWGLGGWGIMEGLWGMVLLRGLGLSVLSLRISNAGHQTGGPGIEYVISFYLLHLLDRTEAM